MMQYTKKHKAYRYDNKTTAHIPTEQIERLRKKTGYGTANRYANFLCAMGLLRKHTQSKDPNIEGMTKVNQEFIKGKPKKYMPMNTFYFYSFGKDGTRLEEINERCKKLIEHKITKGNISKSKLETNGLPELAEELYSETMSAVDWYAESYCSIFNFLQEHIKSFGYATMQNVYENVTLKNEKNVEAIDKVISNMKNQFTKDFRYGRPKKAEKEKYQLQSDRWIITEHPAEGK